MKNKETTYKNLNKETEGFTIEVLESGLKYAKEQVGKKLYFPPMCKHGLSKGTLCLGCIHKI